MSTVPANAVTDLLKREPAKIVAATGIFFESLAKRYAQRTVADILESHRGGVWGAEAGDGCGYPVLRSTNMRGSKANVADVAWREIPTKQAEACTLQTGDILVTKSSGSSDLVGKSVLFLHPGDRRTYLFSNFTYRLRPNANVIVAAFLAWFLRSPQALGWRYDTQQNAVGLRNLQTEEFLSQRLPMPPLPIQQAVTTYLDGLEAGRDSSAVLPPDLAEQRRIVSRIEHLAAKIEEARGLRSRSVGETNALVESALDVAFKPRPNWKEARVANFCENPQYGYTASATVEPLGPRLLRITDIQNGQVDWDRVPFCNCPNPQQYLLRENDLVFARTGATTGKSFLIRNCPPAVFASYLIRLRVKSLVSIEYLYKYFQSPSYWRQIVDEKKGTGQPNVNGRKLANVKVPVPPPDEQRRIVSYLDDLQAKVDALKKLQSETTAELDALMPSILSKAFRGEL